MFGTLDKFCILDVLDNNQKNNMNFNKFQEEPVDPEEFDKQFQKSSLEDKQFFFQIMQSQKDMQFHKKYQNLSQDQKESMAESLKVGCNLANEFIFALMCFLLLFIVLGSLYIGNWLELRILVEFGISIALAVSLDSLNCLCIKRCCPETNRKTIQSWIGILFCVACLLVGCPILGSNYNVFSEKYNFNQIALESLVSFGPAISISWSLFPHMEDLIRKLIS